MTMTRACLVLVGLLTLLLAATIAVCPRSAVAQSPSALGDEELLSLVLPAGPGGARVPVHMWARADQAQGPGGYPTVFVVSLFTEQAASGPEEHEVVNYVQYTNGSWTPARPRGDGTLLLDDWAWISQNLTNLTAAASGSGGNSSYTVDYAASGPSGSGTRQLAVEEVYGADLSLLSSTVLSDTNPSAAATGSPAPAGNAAAPSASPAQPGASATAVPVGPPGSNVIRIASPTATPAH